MPTPAAPSSLDRAAVRETLEEHTQLRAAIDTLEAALASPRRAGGGPWRATLVERLDGLHAALARHFAAEEARHLFEAIEDAWPPAFAACRRLRADHRRLLTELGRLCAEAERPGAGRATTRDWVHRARALLAALGDHEERENALLFDALEPTETAQD